MKIAKNLIFDFDGVILDSVKVKDKSFKIIVKSFNKKIKHLFKEILGAPM